MLGTRVALLALGLAAAACSMEPSTPAPRDLATFEVKRRDLRVTVTERGELRTARFVPIRPQIPGAAKIVSVVEEGTEVKEGDVLCELDRTDKKKEVDDLENRSIQLRAQLTAAEAELQIQLGQNQKDLNDAAMKQRFAEVEAERFEKAEYVQERKKRDVRVEKARSEVARTTKRHEQMPALLAEGFVTPEQVEEERIKKVEAEAELALATLDLDSYEKFTAPRDREQRQADVRNAAIEVERSRQSSAAREVQKRADVEKHRNELANVDRALANGRAILARMTIRAPTSGMVLYGDASNPWNEERKYVKVGESVYAGKAFMTIPDLSEMQAVIAIHQTDFARVKPGQKAFVVVDSATETQIAGEVTRVAQIATQSKRWSDEVKRFNVDVTLRGDISQLRLKPGVTARVEILVGERQGVLAVPIQAIFAERGQFFVFKRRGDSVQRSEVQVEDGDQRFAIVTEGVAEGDQILLVNPGGTLETAPAVAGAATPPVPPQSSRDAARGKP